MKLVEYLSGTVVATYHDPEQSGYRRDRPELKKLLRDVETGVVDLVVCEAPDRLARDAEDVVFLSTKLMYHRVALHTVSKGMLTRSSSRSPAGWDLPEASGGQDGTGNGSGRTGGPLCRRPRLRVHSTHAASSFAACSRSTKPRPSSSSGSSQSSRLAGRLSRSPPASMPKASPAAWRPVECVDDPRGPGEGDGHPQQSALCRSTDVGTPAVAPQSGQRKARTALSLAGPL
jgi:hypothetical protein